MGWMQNHQHFVSLRIQQILVYKLNWGIESIFLQPVEVSPVGGGMKNIHQVLPLQAFKKQ
jgi:hypothetical protein